MMTITCLILWIPLPAALEALVYGATALDVLAFRAVGWAEETAVETPPAALRSTITSSQMNERRLTEWFKSAEVVPPTGLHGTGLVIAEVLYGCL